MSHRRKSARPTNKHWMCVDQNMSEENSQEDQGESFHSDQNITIPSDIYKDFEALKNATNLDSTTLMRRLLKDYHRLPSPEISPERNCSDERNQHYHENEDIVQLEKAPGQDILSLTFDQASVVAGSAQDCYIVRDTDKSPEPMNDVFSSEEPLDLSVVAKTERSSPDMVLDDNLFCGVKRLADTSLSQNSPEISKVTSSSIISDTDVMPTPVTSNECSVIMPSPLRSDCNIVMSSSMSNQCNVVMSTDRNDCNFLMPMQMSMQLPTVTALDSGQKLVTGNFSIDQSGTGNVGNLVAIPIIQSVSGSVPTIASAPPLLPPPPVTRTPPQAARRGRRPGSQNRGGRTQKIMPPHSGEMKIVAENTMFPGVYTSILKLPWSRRSRTKAVEPPPPQPSPSVVLLPVPISSASSTSNASVSSVSESSLAPSTSQSVMMVYPNATISALGKPVRKRGRPPKLPVLSHLLAEKKSKKDQISTQVATSMANHQSASISADGSMLSILSTQSIGAPAPPSSELKKLQLIKEVSADSLHQSYALKTEKKSSHESHDIQSKPSVKSTTKSSNGALYQEMILSSKSLISIKPRRRQSSDLIKSGDNFICTSFRIRPRGTRHSRSVACELRARRQMNVARIETSSTEIAEEGSLRESPTTTVEDLPSNKTMFQELYHCKVCNEIVPAEDKQSHQQQHVPVKVSCSSCGLEYHIFLGKDSEESKSPDDLKCDRCSGDFSKSNFPLSGPLLVKTNGLLCDLCGQQFKTIPAYREHRKEIHEDEKLDIESYACEECGKIFYSVKGLRCHRKSHPDKSVPCAIEDCPCIFPEKEEMDQHVIEHHDKKKEYVCQYDECKKKFMKNFHLQEHVRVKHYNIRAYTCSWPGCHKEFAAERHLKVHLLIHKDEKPLKCDYCHYRCRQRNALNWHMRKHPEAPYKYRKFGMLSSGDD